LGSDQVKYLNSPESLIYKKGEHLFAFHLAKEAIKAKDAVIVVEGYFDAITAHLYGFTNTVAALGTALTNEQGKLLVRYTESKRVYLAFDTDSAGVKATEKGAHILDQLASGIGIDLRVTTVSGGKDPDECLRAPDGLSTFSQSLENAQSLIEYELGQTTYGCDIKTRDGRIEAARKVVPILAAIKNAVARSEYIRQMAHKFDIQEDSLASDVAVARKTIRPGSGSPQGIYGSISQSSLSQTANPGLRHDRFRPLDGLIEAERWLLASFLSDKANYELTFQSLAKEELMTTPHSKIIKAIYELGNTFADTAQLESRLLDHFAPEPQCCAALIEIMLRAEEIKKQKISIPVLLLQSRVKLMKEKIVALTKTIRNQIASGNDSYDQSLLQSKISELNRMERLTLPTIKTMDEVDNLQEIIKEIHLSLNNPIGERS